MSKSSANGEVVYAMDTCRNHDDEFHLKYDGQVSVGAGYHGNAQRRPMDVQYCDHVVTSLPRAAAANGCAAVTEVNRNSYG